MRAWHHLFAVLIAFGLGVVTHAAYIRYHHPLKHTWECQIVSVNGPIYWFQRPNKELFEMYFDNPPKDLRGLSMYPLRDLTYTDDNADLRHFVKAQIK